MPTAGGLGTAVRKGHAIGCTAVQVFTSNPQTWRAKEITEKDIRELDEARAETGIDCVVSHDSYLVNLASPDDENRAKSEAALIGELTRCSRLGIRWAVSHMGAHMGQGVEVGQQRVAESALRVLEQTPDDVMLLMETTAGQGSVLNSRFEELGELLRLCDGHPRLGVCVDTCHLYVAGYDWTTAEGYDAMWTQFDRLIGLSLLKAIHVNDSKKGLGSRVDRHEHIGLGAIGAAAFARLMVDPRFADIPFLLETPEAETMHAENVAKLWELSGAR